MVDLYAIAPELPRVEVIEAALPADAVGRACCHVVTLDREKIGDDEGYLNAVLVHEAAHVLGGESAAFSDGGHGLGFVRRCCHLYHRARLAGYVVSEQSLFDSGLSSPSCYLFRLRDELEETTYIDLRTIDGIEAPAAFIHLYQSDKQHGQ